MADATPETQQPILKEGVTSNAADLSSSQRVAETYRTYGRELWAMFFAVCGDPERAWDAVQQAFLRLQEQNETVIQDPRA